MTIKCFMIGFLLLTLINCGSVQIVQQIDSKIQQKQIIGQQKEQKLLDIFQGGQVLKAGYLELLQNKIGGLDGYRAFFMENLRCQGLNPNIQLFIDRGQIVQEPCLKYPISSEALPHLVRTYILQNAQYNSSLALKTRDTFKQLKEDSQEYFNILKTLSFQPIQILRSKLAACMAQYASQYNQHPPQCADQLANLYRISDLHQQKYIDVSKPYGSFFEIIHYLRANLSYFQAQLIKLQKIEFENRKDVQVADVSVKYDQCKAGLEASKSQANNRLAAVQASFKKIESLKQNLTKLFAEAEATIQKAKTATEAIRSLGEQLKQSV